MSPDPSTDISSDTSPSAGGRVHRRPVRAIVGGILAGIGFALLLLNFKVIALGTLTPWIVMGIGVVVGLLVAFVAPPRPRLRSR